jgi:hypothetical protein
MGRHIGALREVADIAEIALIDHLPIVFLVYSIDLACAPLVDEVKERRKRSTQANAAPASVADVKDPLHFIKAGLLVIKRWVLPVQWVPGGRL